jgi:hypothetical protein
MRGRETEPLINQLSRAVIAELATQLNLQYGELLGEHPSLTAGIVLEDVRNLGMNNDLYNELLQFSFRNPEKAIELACQEGIELLLTQ